MYHSAAVAIAILLVGHVCAERVCIELKDGRVICGELDGRSDDHRIWIGVRSDRVSVASAFQRNEVVRSWQDSQQSTTVPSVRLHPRNSTPDTQNVLAVRTQSTQRVVSLEIDAAVANWDVDADPDGVLLTIYPLDEYRNVVPIGGTVHAKLLTWVPGRDQDEPVAVLERWARTATSEVVKGTSGVRMRLPFVKFRSTNDQRWLGDGILEVRFGVQGQGAVSARLPIAFHSVSPAADQVLLRSSTVKSWTSRTRRAMPRATVPVVSLGSSARN